MGRATLPGTVVITCPFPPRQTAMEAAGWLRTTGPDAVVTWIGTLESLPALRDARALLGMAAARHEAALALEPAWLRAKTSLRAAVRAAREAWPGLSVAVLPEGEPVAHRDVLVQEGITTICTAVFNDAPRGSRRPAPRGWPCRSVLWGLWEVATAAGRSRGMLGRVRSWCVGPAEGSLTILHASAGPGGSWAAARSRLERHAAWTQRHIRAGHLQPATLADLPALIAGRSAAGPRGSILRAA